MWTRKQIIDDLRDIGLKEGDNVLVHTSLRKIGAMEAGPETLLDALLTVLGPEGTLVAPTFTSNGDPAEWRHPPTDPAELELLRIQVPVFDASATPADTLSVGYFPELVRRHPQAKRSNHPVVSFAAIGANAAFFTRTAPFHYPLGSSSPLARLHQVDGSTLLLGAEQTANSSIHLAEVWADVPYIHRSSTLKTAPDVWSVMRGSPECSAGFNKIEPLLRHSRILREGYVGNAASQLMNQRAVVSMAITMLQGNGAALLCNDKQCPWCSLAHKFTAAQRP
jgi:aminoglycoside 3-N-acetyltransferase